MAEMTPEQKAHLRQQREQLERRALFAPCGSKDHLKAWIKRYLDIDLPDVIVCDDDQTTEPSNSSPMDLIWEVYQKALDGTDENFQRVLAYAARDAGKTLAASILEILCIFHLGRNVAHMAAIEAQAQKCASYIGKYLKKNYLKEFVVGSNKREITISRYEDSDGNILSPDEYDQMDIITQRRYERFENYIKIIIASISGANSEHCSFMCVDGDSKILVKNNDQYINRQRVARTARGIFKRLAGIPHGGRTGGETALEVTEPKEIIEALTLNIQTGNLEFKKIIRAHRNKKRLFVVKLDNHQLSCTEDHPLFVFGKGFVQTKDLVIGDKVFVLKKGRSAADRSNKTNEGYSPGPVNIQQYDEWEQVMMGSALGDAGIYKKPKNNAYLYEWHCQEQGEYLLWKKAIVSRKVRVIDVPNAKSGYTGEPQVAYRTGCSPILNRFVDLRHKLIGIEQLTPLGLAIWYMDDGIDCNGFGLSTEGFSEEQQDTIIEFLKSHFGIESQKLRYHHTDGKEYVRLTGPVASKRRLVELCKDFIHPSMAYKFDVSGNTGNCLVCGKQYWFIDAGTGSKTCGEAVCRGVINGVWHASPVQSITEGKEEWVYDFTIEDNHNFFANGLLNKNCLDELDLAPEGPLEEAKMIPAPGEINGELPITFMTSSRKFAFGNVQKEIDKAAKDKDYGLQIRHWNLIDVTRSCPPTRHLPDEPKIPIYYSEQTLNAIGQSDYDLLSPNEQSKFLMKEGYAGCLSRCSLFSVCRGRLATKQTGTSKMLKPIPHIATQFKSVSPERAKAQLMCWKPSSEGLIYPNFQYARHMLDPLAMYEKISGEHIPRKTPTGQPNPAFIKATQEFTKAHLVDYMLSRGMEIHTGMDWGYTHYWAVVTAAREGHRLFVFDVIAVAGLETTQKLEIFKSRAKKLDPTVWPDSEDPASIATFRKAGFRMRKLAKDILGGIESVRSKLMPGLGQEPEIYFLAGDDGCELLAQMLSQYHWKLDANQKPTNLPDDKDDDLCFTAGHEALTLNGWKTLETITSNDTILAVTPEGNGIWELAVPFSKFYSGEGFECKNHPHIEFQATSDHKHAVMCQMDWKVKKQYKLQKLTVDEMCGTMFWANNLHDWEAGPGFFSQGADEAWMAGFWVAEGCFDTGRPTFLIFDQAKIQHQDTFRQTAKRLGWTWSETIAKINVLNRSKDRKPVIRFVASRQKERAVFFREHFGSGAQNKKLKIEDITQMTLAERKAFWEGYMCGDGCRTGSFWHFDSISKQLIEGIQILTLSLGYGCRIVSYDCMQERETAILGSVCDASQIYRGHVLRRKPVAHINKHKEFDKIQINAQVYCLRTSTGMFLSRYNGKPFVAGNCDATRYLVQGIYGNTGKLSASIPGVSPHVAYDPSFPVPGAEAPVGIENAQEEHFIGSTVDNFLTNKINELTEGQSPDDNDSAPKIGKKGSFVWSL